MTFQKLVLQSLFHYRTVNVMVFLGVALTSAIISGALVVGDSVRESLRRNAEARLSKVDSVLVGGERFFTTELAGRLQENAMAALPARDGDPEILFAPILQVEGTVSVQGGGRRSNRVQILGVEDRFWTFGRSGTVPEKLEGADWFGVNDILARRLGLKEGDPLICRVEIPGELSRDAPLSGESEQTQPFTGNISAVLGADDMGRYSLRAEQVPRGTVFLPLERLQSILEKPGKANVILGREAVSGTLEKLAAEGWRLPDASFEIKQHDGLNSLTSARIFIDPATAERAEAVADSADSVLTYLANKIRCGEKLTPYSMITGASANLPSPVTDDLGADGIILSEWLAEDLAAAPGDTVTLDFYVMETGRRLVEESATFTVHSIAKIGENGWDQSWTPEFPGIFEVEDLGSWEPGIPIDQSLIRDKDEDYWDTHRATPKAFISLEAARRIFSNRFGNTTSVRFKTASLDEYEKRLEEALDLSDIGLDVRQVGAEARQAVSQSFDFGSLFASMSFFLIAAALVLTALIFLFGIESRSDQIGLLLATGFTAPRARRLFLTEAALIAVAASLAGLLGGWIYTNLALRGMSGAWSDAAAGIDFVYHVKPATLILSFGVTVLLALFTVWFASRAVTRVRPSRLIAGGGDDYRSAKKPLLRTVSFWGALVFLLSGLGCLFAPKVEGTMAEQGLFFGAGFCLTLAGICLAGLGLRRLDRPSSSIRSLGALGRQNTVRRKGRSLAVIGLMAAGVFMVTAINSFRLEGERGAMRRDSGTGGFTHVGESTLPIYEDLNAPAGREKYGLDQFDDIEFTIVPFRVTDGDDASCLNLNRAQRPRLMGVDPALISSFSETPFNFTRNIGPDELPGWKVLRWHPGSGYGVIPAVVDMNTATYSLQAKAGDRIEYESADDEPFEVEIAAFLETSILQGNLIISEEEFIRKFPDSGGYRFFLLDCADPEGAERIASHLTRMFGERGLEMRSAAERLNEFNAVQNTYLSIFSTLGGLGVLLGTLGLAIVVGRNVMERRGQLGLMQAVGFTRQSLVGMILSEHWFLHLTGVLLGMFAAFVAVLPKVISRASELPWALLIGVNLAILAGGLIFCWLAAKLALRGRLIEALRTE